MHNGCAPIISETTDSLYSIYWVPLQWAQVEIRKATGEKQKPALLRLDEHPPCLHSA